MLPDPQDPDPVRYAILACIAEELVDAFNWRLALGMRRKGPGIPRDENGKSAPFIPQRLPAWTPFVPAIEPYMFVDLPAEMVHDGKLILEEDGYSPVFAKRNIVTNVGWLYTV